MAIFGRTGDIHVTAGSDGAKFLLVSGSSINEPVARMGPFVMNTREELLQAAEDYRRGTLA
jgi:redox-sensitive bicupin YhaK (pirin superfamily)